MRVEFFHGEVGYVESLISSWLFEMEYVYPGYTIFKVNQSVLPSVKKSDGGRLVVSVWFEEKTHPDCLDGIKEQ